MAKLTKLHLILYSLTTAVWYNAFLLCLLALAMIIFYLFWLTAATRNRQRAPRSLIRIIVLYAGAMVVVTGTLTSLHIVGILPYPDVSYLTGLTIIAALVTGSLILRVRHRTPTTAPLHLTSLTLSLLGLLHVWIAFAQFGQLGTLPGKTGAYILLFWLVLIYTLIRLHWHRPASSIWRYQRLMLSVFTAMTLLFTAGYWHALVTPAHSAMSDSAADSPAAGMVSIPAGKFWYGCVDNLDPDCEPIERPGRWVYLDSFYIDPYEVTVADYRECVEAGGCTSDGLRLPIWFHRERHLEFAWACNWGKRGHDTHPINCVSYEQATQYCEWRGKRLPTDVEWEKAARGAADTRIYPWGNQTYSDIPVANIADESAGELLPHWPYLHDYDDSAAATAPVGTFPGGASPYGVYDMIGNVEEWTVSWYDETLGQHSMKGSSWHRSADTARISFRYKSDLDAHPDYGGFRCAF